MGRFVRWIQGTALALGAPGIFLVAFLDSSILSLPEIADLLVIWMVTYHKARFLLYVGSATLGSILGCLVLYGIGKSGGASAVRRRFTSSRIEQALGAFRRYGLMAVLIPSILPPPAPFKIFVFVAGVADISLARFSAAILVGRGARYAIEGLLAVWYGERAMSFIRDHATSVSLVVVGVLVVGFVPYWFWTKSRNARQR
jgi:membrane protein YqaA with SNARE-associated domain